MNNTHVYELLIDEGNPLNTYLKIETSENLNLITDPTRKENPVLWIGNNTKITLVANDAYLFGLGEREE